MGCQTAFTGNTLQPSQGTLLLPPGAVAELLFPWSWHGGLQYFSVSAVGSSPWCSLCPCCDLQPSPLTLLPALNPLVPPGPLPCPLEPSLSPNKIQKTLKLLLKSCSIPLPASQQQVSAVKVPGGSLLPSALLKWTRINFACPDQREVCVVCVCLCCPC